jgi:uncharacterized membrane protein YhaH (DUF805 family)
MGFQEAVQAVLSKYADFNGRARRSEFWYWVLAVVIADIVVSIIGKAIGTNILGLLLGLAIIVPNLAVGSRRLHDIGKSGWLQLIGLIPIVGWILLIVWYATEGQPGDNQYGPNPKGMGTPAAGYGMPPTG